MGIYRRFGVYRRFGGRGVTVVLGVTVVFGVTDGSVGFTVGCCCLRLAGFTVVLGFCRRFGIYRRLATLLWQPCCGNPAVENLLWQPCCHGLISMRLNIRMHDDVYASNLLYIMHDTHFYSIWWLLLKEGCQSPGSTPYRRSCQELCIERTTRMQDGSTMEMRVL